MSKSMDSIGKSFNRNCANTMGCDDSIDDSELGNLPPEAFGNIFDTDGPFDPDDSWLMNAERDEQRTAIREWFLARYCDPAEETPYNGREGGYLFIHGGPYDPADEIPERFSGLVDDDLIGNVIDELHGEGGGDAWAPVNWEPDYDNYLTLAPDDRDEPGVAFNNRLGEIDRVLALTPLADLSTARLLEQMAFGSIISAVEAYLAETVTFWTKNDKEVLRRVVSKEFKDKKFSLAEIFDHLDKIENDVLVHLANQVWHRLDKLKPTIEYSLGIELPDIGPLMSAVEKRHDIVHRAGKTKVGKQITIGADEVLKLRSGALTFVNAINAELNKSFPHCAGPDEF